jgi:hypothetical protein
MSTPTSGDDTSKKRIDPLTEQWLEALRDPAHKQATAEVSTDGGARCAMAWAPEFRQNQNRMRARYGRRFLNKIERMNGAGVPLPEIGDYIEREYGDGD